jgi:hypothetical protein
MSYLYILSRKARQPRISYHLSLNKLLMNLRKSLLCLSVIAFSAAVTITASAIGNEPVSATANTTIAPTTKATSSDVDQYISDVYAQIDFGKGSRLAAEVFNKAMHGYLNLKEAGKLGDKQMLTVADFTESSTQNRLWIFDLKNNKVVYNTYVAHGQGSGMDYATSFSNTDGTHASSLGFFVTGDTYTGQHGNSLRLNGVDRGFNDAALDRGIVVHAADYVSKGCIASQGRLGRSWGCPAVAPELAQPIINTIKGGTCLFIYYPQASYMKTAYWMNKKVDNFPTQPGLQLTTPAIEHSEQIAEGPKRDTVITHMAAANRI